MRKPRHVKSKDTTILRLTAGRNSRIAWNEISAMPYDPQGKLLRVLQEDYIRRVGGKKDIPIDVRIIANVNEPPEALIQSGALRKDLYYRLNIVNLTIPPLRERLDDLPLLVDRFLEKHNQRYGKEVWMVFDRALEKLKNTAIRETFGSWKTSLCQLFSWLTRSMSLQKTRSRFRKLIMKKSETIMTRKKKV